MKFEWERLTDNDFRAKIIGGWLVQSYYREGSCETSVACSMTTVFVSDPGHVWDINKDNNEHLKNITIYELPLLVRTMNCLRAENINTVYDLINKTTYDLMIIPNFGRKSLNDVNEALKKLGLPSMGK